jgi:CDP-diacylglycerol--serine O-phosphatidyltransferase
MLLVIYAVAALMVSEIRYFSFKEIRLYRRHPFSVLLGLILLLMLTVGAPQPMLFLGATGYAVSGPLGLALRLATGRRRRPAAPAAEPPAVPRVVLDKPAPRR